MLHINFFRQFFHEILLKHAFSCILSHFQAKKGQNFRRFAAIGNTTWFIMYLAAFTLDFTLVAHRKFCQHINFLNIFMGNTYGRSTKKQCSEDNCVLPANFTINENIRFPHITVTFTPDLILDVLKNTKPSLASGPDGLNAFFS